MADLLADMVSRANICGTDDEGFGLREGMRGGFSFTLILGRGGVGKLNDGLLPTARFIGSSQATANFGTSSFLFPYRWANKVKGRHIADDKWHHVAWQFRYKDQLNTFFLDGKRVAKISLFDLRSDPRAGEWRPRPDGFDGSAARRVRD